MDTLTYAIARSAIPLGRYSGTVGPYTVHVVGRGQIAVYVPGITEAVALLRHEAQPFVYIPGGA